MKPTDITQIQLVPVPENGGIVLNVIRIPFLIVGGGIGGLAAALAIAKTGCPVHMIDKAAQFAEIGSTRSALSRLGASRTTVWRR